MDYPLFPARSLTRLGLLLPPCEQVLPDRPDVSGRAAFAAQSNDGHIDGAGCRSPGQPNRDTEGPHATMRIQRLEAGSAPVHF